MSTSDAVERGDSVTRTSAGGSLGTRDSDPCMDWHEGSSALVSVQVNQVCVMSGLLAASRGMEVPHPIAAGNRLEGQDCHGWRLRHRLGDATAGSALDRPALEGYMIGSG